MKKYFILAFKTENSESNVRRLYVNDELTIGLLNEGWLVYRMGECQVGVLVNNEVLWKDHKEEILSK